MKKIFTTSMLETFRLCRKKYIYRYIDQIIPATIQPTPSAGNLWHDLMEELYSGEYLEHKEYTQRIPIKWRMELIERFRKNIQEQNDNLGLNEIESHDEIIEDLDEQCREIAQKIMEIYAHYLVSVFPEEDDQFETLFTEQNFDVPFVDNDGNRHPYWRFRGRWDRIKKHRESGKIFIDDHKLTSMLPDIAAINMALNPQAPGYTYAGRYLANVKNQEEDSPTWNHQSPTGFTLSITRKKCPKEPPVLKSGKLSKAKNIDTTPELYRLAIKKNNLREEDYADILEVIERRGFTFHVSEDIPVGKQEIEQWVTETKRTLKEIEILEQNPEIAYRAAAQTCQNQYGRRCAYHELCYGDKQAAMLNFVHKPAHSELKED